MSIVKTLSQSEFMDELKGDEYANWSYDGAQALYDYYEQLSDDIGEPIEFDRVAIRCDWYEWDNLKEAFDNYGGEPEEGDEYSDAQALEYLTDRTIVIELDNGHVLIEAF